jgi:hypothetical protein
MNYHEYLENIFGQNTYPNRGLLKEWIESTIPGLILEFGVFNGESISEISSYTERKVYGFDSFEGLPESWYGMEKGSFITSPPTVPENVELVVGWFDQSLPGFLTEHTENVAFVHIDSDLYSSAKYILNTLKDRLVPGSIILFDELAHYGLNESMYEYRKHEFKAFVEFLEETKLNIELLGRRHNEAYAFKIID